MWGRAKMFKRMRDSKRDPARGGRGRVRQGACARLIFANREREFTFTGLRKRASESVCMRACVRGVRREGDRYRKMDNARERRRERARGACGPVRQPRTDSGVRHIACAAPKDSAVDL